MAGTEAVLNHFHWRVVAKMRKPNINKITKEARILLLSLT